MRYSLALLLLFATLGSSAIAQNSPAPVGTPPLPITGYLGRYFDSASTAGAIRTGSILVRRDADRIAMWTGGELFFYQLSTFDATLATPYAIGPNGEQYRTPLVRITPAGSVKAWDFDAHGIYILTSTGLQFYDTTGALRAQCTTTDCVNAWKMQAIAAHGTTYVVITKSDYWELYFDATQIGAPVLAGQRYVSFAGNIGWVAARTDSGRRIAFMAIMANGCNVLMIYNSDGFVDGADPIGTATFGTANSWMGANEDFFVLATGNDTQPNVPSLYRLTFDHGGSSTIDTLRRSYIALPQFPSWWAAHDGYLALIGSRTGNTFNDEPSLRLYRYDTATPTLFDLSSYTLNAWPSLPYVQASGGPTPVTINGVVHLLLPLRGLGEVFTLQRPPFAMRDFNADGNNDVLWWNTSTGEIAAWLLRDGHEYAGVSLGRSSLAWRPGGMADFDGDGSADILWRNQTTGENVIWLMNGTAWRRSVILPSAATNWYVEATGDITGDGQPDIVWHDHNSGIAAVWRMSGTVAAMSMQILSAIPPWHIAALADVTHDTKNDLIWRNTTTGEVVEWTMNGTNAIASSALGSLQPDWQIVSVLDYDGDVYPEVYLHNTTTGQNQIWKLETGQMTVVDQINNLQWQGVGPR